MMKRVKLLKLMKLKLLRSDYKHGTVPQDVILATMACDVQEDRIEAELLGYGEDGKTWSIDYYVFEGNTQHAHSGAFALLKNKIIEGDFPIIPAIIGIDSGYRTDTVHEFCRGASSIVPVWGTDYIKNKLYRESAVTNNGNMSSYEISTGIYKQKIYSRLFLKKDLDGIAPSGYCSFPYDYPDPYFEMLCSEKRYNRIQHGKIIGYLWRKKHSNARNEALDCRVYNLALFDILTDIIAKQFEIEKPNYKITYEYFKKKVLKKKNEK